MMTKTSAIAPGLYGGPVPGNGKSIARLIRRVFNSLCSHFLDRPLAQLVERLFYTQNVGGSNPSGPTKIKIVQKEYVMKQVDKERFFNYLRSPGGGNCTEVKEIKDGMYVAIKPLLFHWTMIIGEIGNDFGYFDRWCYASQTLAEKAFSEWNGEGEPTGWHRHPSTGRRRENGNPELEYYAP